MKDRIKEARIERQIKRIKDFSLKHNVHSEIWLDRIGKGIEIINLGKGYL